MLFGSTRALANVGKTTEAIRQYAEQVKIRRERGDRRPYLYALPTHRVGEEVAAAFRKLGVTAEVFRGRKAEDPEHPGQTMCADLAAVQIALDLGTSVSTSCCRDKEPGSGVRQCQHYSTCAYQRQ